MVKNYCNALFNKSSQPYNLLSIICSSDQTTMSTTTPTEDRGEKIVDRIKKCSPIILGYQDVVPLKKREQISEILRCNILPHNHFHQLVPRR